MKIKQEHYNHIKNAIMNCGTTINEQRLNILNSGKQPKDFYKRLRWDMSYLANLTPYICANLYSYLDDTHIDTALRAIIKELDN